jgi:hypothetical protein
MLARFVERDSSEETMRLLQSYLERNGRPLSFYTDKASLFAKSAKDQAWRTGRQGACGAAADSDRARAERAGHRVEGRALPASQRTDRAWIWHGTRSPAEGLTGSGSQDAGASQCLSGSRILSVVESDAHGGAGFGRRCAWPARQRAQSDLSAFSDRR